MTTIPRAMIGGLLAALTLVGLNTPANGQGRDVRPEVRAVVKSVSGTNLTVSVPSGGRGDVRENAVERSFALAPDVEVAVGTGGGGGRTQLFQAGKAADLTPGLLVSLTLSADEKTVESILADTPLFRGTVKQVDLAAKTLSVETLPAAREQSAETKTFTLADNAEVAVDDGRGRRFSVREARLADVAPGSSVIVWLTLDRQKALAIQAEGVAVQGTVKSFDSANRSLVLTVRPARGDDAGDERSITLAEDAAILLNDGKGKRLSVKAGAPADIVAGSSATIRLSVDQGRAMMVHLEGPAVFGLLTSADAANGTITVSFPRGRGDAPEEKTIAVAKDARITVDGVASTLAALKPGEDGPRVLVRLSLDQKTAQNVTAQQNAGR